MKINKLILILSLITSSLFLSCEDADKDKFNDFLTTAAFPKFANVSPPATVGLDQISDLVYSFEIIDANNNMATYQLDMFAVLSGEQTETVTIDVATTFPVSYSFTAADLAGFLGLEQDDITFGDSFFFTATATTNDGLVYNGSERLGFDDLDDDDPSTNRFLGGGVTNDLLDEAGYRQAFEFDFIILCPEVNLDNFVGTYEVVVDAWADYAPGDILPVVAGSNSNSFRILSVNNPFIANPDTSYIEITVNTTDGTITAESNEPFNYGPGFALNVTGIGLTADCAGLIIITLDFGPFTGNAFTIKKI